MECPSCKSVLNMPPVHVLKMMSGVIKQRCSCGCHLQIDQMTSDVTIIFNPNKQENTDETP